MSFNRNQIVQFLEKCVFKTLTKERYPTEFSTIIDALRERYKDSDKFSEEVLDNVTAIKVDRDVRKSLQVAVQYNNQRKWNKISWTNMYSSQSSQPIQPTHHSKVCKAFRQEIKDQAAQFLQCYHGHPKCELCGTLGGSSKIEVDHKKPKTFSWIMAQFLTINNINENDISVGWTGRRYVLNDQVLCNKWTIYHAQQATFRLLCSSCNKKQW